jgi:hypothetical protein
VVLKKSRRRRQFKSFELLGVSLRQEGDSRGWFHHGLIDFAEQDETVKWGMTTPTPPSGRTEKSNDDQRTQKPQ